MSKLGTHMLSITQHETQAKAQGELARGDLCELDRAGTAVAPEVWKRSSRKITTLARSLEGVSSASGRPGPRQSSQASLPGQGIKGARAGEPALPLPREGNYFWLESWNQTRSPCSC